MKKVAILTFHRVPNHGAVLQAYALQQTIIRLGTSCEILDLLRPQHEGYKISSSDKVRWPYGKNTGEKKPRRRFWAYAKKRIASNLEHMILAKAALRYRAFDQMCLKFSSSKYANAEELFIADLDYDAYVTGSDQVWNPTYSWSPEPYFLTFVPPGFSRIAYAPSFGVSAIDATVQHLYSKWLRDITHLSVREVQGAEIVKRLTGRNAPVVLDPTLLLTDDEWKKLAKEPQCRKPYIFCYSVGDVPGLMVLCYHLQKITGYPIYKIGYQRQTARDMCNWKIRTITDAGPQEFLGYLKDAAIVVTNSFHGTVLSINLQKPFFTVPSSVTSTYSRNSRLFSILRILSASERLYRFGQELPSSANLEMSFDTIAQELKAEREYSLSYLKNAIAGAKNEHLS